VSAGEAEGHRPAGARYAEDDPRTVQGISPASTAAVVHRWIVRHDDSRLFLVLYISLALVLSIVIGLFWLVALVAVHFAFEHVRFRHEGKRTGAALLAALDGVKLDVGLVLFALALALHMQVVMGLLGLQAASRAGAAAQAGMRGVRFAAWEKVIRGIALSIDDAFQGARAVAAVRRKPAASGAEAGVGADAAAVAPSEGSRTRWITGDVLSLALCAVCLLLILAAPLTASYDGWGAVLRALAAELHPFPAR
jgi:hypothetical protein